MERVSCPFRDTSVARDASSGEWLAPSEHRAPPDIEPALRFISPEEASRATAFSPVCIAGSHRRLGG